MKYNSVININDYLVPLDRINDKLLSELTFIESLSLCIHGVHCAVKSNIDEWIFIWEQFQTNIHNQNVENWPVVTCVNNYINNKFILTAVTDKQFITNKCILLNIFNIIYLEQHKYIYASFENIGVTTSNEAGTALLKVRKPQPYSVPFKGRLEPHIHYRVCNPDGMMERVNTVYITDSDSSAGAIEGFTSVTTGVDPNKLISEFTKDPKKFMNSLSMAVPQISQVMEALNNQFVSDMHGGAEAHQATEQLDGGAIAEAFRSY